MLRVIFVLSLLVAVFLVPIQAEITKVDRTAFTAKSVLLDFSGFRTGVEAGEIYAKWGVHFSGSGGSVPRILVLTPPIGGIPDQELNRVVRNEAEGGSSARMPLVIDFTNPVSRVGFTVSNGVTTTSMSISAYDSTGTKVGSTTESGTTQPKFVAVSTTSDKGISKLVLDFGTVESGEQIDDLIFEYLTRPKFTTFLAQVGDLNDLLQTIVVITNLTNSTADGEVRFFASNGTAMEIQSTEGPKAAVYPFSIPAFSSKTITTSGEGQEVAVGYGVIESDVPVEGTAIFRIIDASGKTLQEAGVGATTARPQALGVVQKIASVGFDSGLAIVNSSRDQAADVTILLYDQQGTLVSTNAGDMDLNPGGHRARYVSELFPSIADEDFSGSLLIMSTQPIALVTIRTLNALPISTLPVGSTQ